MLWLLFCTVIREFLRIRTPSVVQFGHSLYGYGGQCEFRYPIPNDDGGLVWAIDEAHRGASPQAFRVRARFRRRRGPWRRALGHGKCRGQATSEPAIREAPLDPLFRLEETPLVDAQGRRWDWIGWADGGPDTWTDVSAEALDGVDTVGSAEEFGIPSGVPLSEAVGDLFVPLASGSVTLNP